MTTRRNEIRTRLRELDRRMIALPVGQADQEFYLLEEEHESLLNELEEIRGGNTTRPVNKP